jgi:hypothetical protein
MCCPKCYNDHLLIRRRTGWERAMIFMTGKRKYVCMSCAKVFRAPDRRRVDREQDEKVLSQADNLPFAG